jgi:hypothetical protein
MAAPLISLGLAAARAAGKVGSKLLKKRKKPEKEPSITDPSKLATSGRQRTTKKPFRGSAGKRAKIRKDQARKTKRRNTKIATNIGGTAALGGADALLTKKEEDKKVDKPKVDKPKASRPKPKTEGKTFKKPTVKTKTGQERAEDASRKRVPVTRISDDKSTKRFMQKEKARKLKTPLQPPSSPKQKRIDARKENMAAAREQSRKADAPLPTTVAAGKKRAEARGENKLAGTFKRVDQGKFVDKAAVTREDLDAWRKRTGNEDLGYKESLRGLLNEARGLKRRGAKSGGTVKKQGFKQGGKVRGAGIATRGVRPTKMVKMKGS